LIVNKMLDDGHKALQHNEDRTAVAIYDDIKDIYKKLDKESKRKLHNRIMQYFSLITKKLKIR